ncbi:hypothetical protein Gotur_014730, partial [Gossypium turneri]
MGWLRDTFPDPDDDSTELERIRYARAYILQVIGAGEFSWGSAVLATLYWKMCGVTRPNKAKIGGCLSLLQSWAWFCFPFFLQTQSPDPAVQPMIPMAQPFHMMPGAYPNPFMYPNPY